MDNVFAFSKYLDFLKFYFSSGKAKTGAKSAYAKACGIQTSYLSQILAEKTQLSPEQALKGCQYLEFNSLETEYFLILVQKARAGTAELEDYYERRLEKIRVEQDKLSSRLDESTTKLSSEATQKYYSSWIYSVVHVIFSLPHVKTLKDACGLIGEDVVIVEEALEFLMAEGMISKGVDGYQTKPANIHLSNDSPLIRQHHTNWRVRSLSSVQKNDPNDLHYSVTFTLSAEDAEKIRQNLLEVVQRNLKLVAPSPEEVMYATTLDFFKLA